MNKILSIVLVLSILVNIAGLFLVYKFWRLNQQVNRLQKSVRESGKTIAKLSDAAEEDYDTRLIFMHHSVGAGILNEGHLRDSLRAMGIAVKGMTYGDSIGQFTDMCDWLPKFQNDMKGIFNFQNHPNVYYGDDKTNDIVMFKSCFPNSDIASDGSGSGDPMSRNKTIENYKAVFAGLSKEMRKYPNKFFIYMTFPPLTPAETSTENAGRAREFNKWLKSEFLPTYTQESGLHNFVIFDLFDVLADQTNVLKAEYRRDDPHDSHPNALGYSEAAQRFMEFFREAWAVWQAGTGALTYK